MIIPLIQADTTTTNQSMISRTPLFQDDALSFNQAKSSTPLIHAHACKQAHTSMHTRAHTGRHTHTHAHSHDHAQVIELDDFKVTHASRYPAPILSLGLSPDCGTLAVGMADGTVSMRRHDRPRAITVGPSAAPPRRKKYGPRLTAANFRCVLRRGARARAFCQGLGRVLCLSSGELQGGLHLGLCCGAVTFGGY